MMELEKNVKVTERPQNQEGIEIKEHFLTKGVLEIAAAGLTAIAVAPKAGETIRMIVDKGKDLINRPASEKK